VQLAKAPDDLAKNAAGTKKFLPARLWPLHELAFFGGTILVSAFEWRDFDSS
jgi:hypothetical protein